MAGVSIKMFSPATQALLDPASLADPLFTVHSVIEALTEEAVSSNPGLDPRPMIRSFDFSLRYLNNLAERQDQREEDLRKAVGRTEKEHVDLVGQFQRQLSQAEKRYNELGPELNPIVDEFDRLELGDRSDGRAGQTGNRAVNLPGGNRGGATAVQIGHTLGQVVMQNERAKDAKILVRCWQDLSTAGSLDKLRDLKRADGKEDKSSYVRVVRIARLLLRIASQLDDPTRPTADVTAKRTNRTRRKSEATAEEAIDPRKLIEHFLDELEQELLAEYEAEMKSRVFSRVYECTKILRQFDNGSSVIARFVENNPYFRPARSNRRRDTDGSSEADDSDDGDGDGDASTADYDEDAEFERAIKISPEIWDRLADPNLEPDSTSAAGLTQSQQLGTGRDADSFGFLNELMDELKYTIYENGALADRTFSYAEDVMVRFIQKLFDYTLARNLNRLAAKAASVSQLAYLRAIQIAHYSISGLVDSLKTNGLIGRSGAASSSAIVILDGLVDRLFGPYVGQAYVEQECKSLETLFIAVLTRFSAYHSQHKNSGAQTFLSFGQKVSELESYVNSLKSKSQRMPSKEVDHLLAIARVRDSDLVMAPSAQAGSSSNSFVDVHGPARPAGHLMIEDTDGDLSVETSMLMLHWLSEATTRACDLTAPMDSPKAVRKLVTAFMNFFANAYIDTALDTCQNMARLLATMTEPSRKRYFETIAAAMNIANLFRSSVIGAIIGQVSLSKQISHEMTGQMTNWIFKVDATVTACLHKTVNASLEATRVILAQTDFAATFRPETIDPDRLAKSSAAEVVAILSAIADTALATMPKEQAPEFFSELALGLRIQLLVHFRSGKVNPLGAVNIRREVSEYMELTKKWPIRPTSEFALSSGMVVLDGLVGLYLLPAESLRGYLGPILQTDFRQPNRSVRPVNLVAVAAAAAMAAASSDDDSADNDDNDLVDNEADKMTTVLHLPECVGLFALATSPAGFINQRVDSESNALVAEVLADLAQAKQG